MPDTNPIRVSIIADDQTNAAIAAASARFRQFENAGASATGSIENGFSRARGAAELFSNTLGIHVSRELRGVLAASDLAGGILAKAFPIAAAVGFGVVIFEIGKKLYDYATNAKEAEEATKKLVEHFKEMEIASGKSDEHIAQLQKDFALIGLTGSAAGVVKIRQLGDDLNRLQAAMRANRDEAYGLRNNWDRLEDSSGKLFTSQEAAGKEATKLDQEYGRLQKVEQELSQEQHNLEKTTIADKFKEDKEAAAKLAAELEKVRTKLAGTADQIFKATHDPIEIVREDWSKTINELTQLMASKFPLLARQAAELIPEAVKAMNAQILAEEQKLLDQIQGDFAKLARETPFPTLPDQSNASRIPDIGPQLEQIQSVVQFQLPLHIKALINLNQALSDSFDRMFDDIALGTRNISQAFASMASAVAASLLKMIVKMIYAATVGKWLESIITGFAPFGGFASRTVPTIDVSGQVPGHLAGGGLAMPGMPYIVGEHGPELFVPNSSGKVIPNGGMGSNVQVNVINQSSQPVSARATKPSFDGRKFVVNVVLEDLQMGGPIRKMLGS